MTPQQPGQPFNPMMGPPPPGSNAIRDAVNVPGILLITYGALSVAYALFSLASNVFMGDANNAAMKQIASDPNLPPALKEFMRTMGGGGGKAINLVFALLSMGLGGLVAFGGFQMRNLQSYGLAMAASIVAMIPFCGGCCCILGLPLGIWSLVTIMRPEVKAAFT